MYGNTCDLSTCDLVSYVPRGQNNGGSNFDIDIGGSRNKSEQSALKTLYIYTLVDNVLVYIYIYI